MGLILKQSISSSAEIGLWEINSLPLKELIKTMILSEKDKLEIFSPGNEFRKKEILATKMLIQELLGKEAEIFYDKNGKPHLKNSAAHISLSHSYQYVAAIIDQKNPTGIDIQKITPKIIRIKEKYLSQNELTFLSGQQNIEKLHVLWGAKECIYKEHGEGNIIFSQHIHVKPFDYKTRGEIIARLELKNYKKNFILGYKKLNDYMLVYIRELVNIVT